MDGGQVARDNRPERRDGCPSGDLSVSTQQGYWADLPDEPIRLVRCEGCHAWVCRQPARCRVRPSDDGSAATARTYAATVFRASPNARAIARWLSPARHRRTTSSYSIRLISR